MLQVTDRLHACPQAFTLTEGPAITSLAVSPDGAYLIAHLVSHTLQLWPLASVLQRLDAAPAVDSLPPGRPRLCLFLPLRWAQEWGVSCSCLPAWWGCGCKEGVVT